MMDSENSYSLRDKALVNSKCARCPKSIVGRGKSCLCCSRFGRTKIEKLCEDCYILNFICALCTTDIIKFELKNPGKSVDFEIKEKWVEDLANLKPAVELAHMEEIKREKELQAKALAEQEKAAKAKPRGRPPSTSIDKKQATKIIYPSVAVKPREPPGLEDDTQAVHTYHLANGFCCCEILVANAGKLASSSHYDTIQYVVRFEWGLTVDTMKSWDVSKSYEDYVRLDEDIRACDFGPFLKEGSEFEFWPLPMLDYADSFSKRIRALQCYLLQLVGNMRYNAMYELMVINKFFSISSNIAVILKTSGCATEATNCARYRGIDWRCPNPSIEWNKYYNSDGSNKRLSGGHLAVQPLQKPQSYHSPKVSVVTSRQPGTEPAPLLAAPEEDIAQLILDDAMEFVATVHLSDSGDDDSDDCSTTLDADELPDKAMCTIVEDNCGSEVALETRQVTELELREVLGDNEVKGPMMKHIRNPECKPAPMVCYERGVFSCEIVGSNVIMVDKSLIQVSMAYLFDCCYGKNSHTAKHWIISRRFIDFVELAESLTQEVFRDVFKKNIDLPILETGALTFTANPLLVKFRRDSLGDYLASLVECVQDIKKFFEVPVVWKFFDLEEGLRNATVHTGNMKRSVLPTLSPARENQSGKNCYVDVRKEGLSTMSNKVGSPSATIGSNIPLISTATAKSCKHSSCSSPASAAKDYSSDEGEAYLDDFKDVIKDLIKSLGEKITAFDQQLIADHSCAISMKKDGNCFYRALSHQLHNTESFYSYYRDKVHDHLLLWANRFMAFVCEPGVLRPDIAYKRYCANVKKNHNYADHVEVMGSEEVINCHIRIYDMRRSVQKLVLADMAREQAEIDLLESKSRPVIRLGYDSEEQHYYSIVGLKVKWNSRARSYCAPSPTAMKRPFGDDLLNYRRGLRAAEGVVGNETVGDKRSRPPADSSAVLHSASKQQRQEESSAKPKYLFLGMSLNEHRYPSLDNIEMGTGQESRDALRILQVVDQSDDTPQAMSLDNKHPTTSPDDNGANGYPTHLCTDFGNPRRCIADMWAVWENVEFALVFLDFFYSPISWAREKWKCDKFILTLVELAKIGFLSKKGASIFLPNMPCVKEAIENNRKNLDDLYLIRYLRDANLNPLYKAGENESIKQMLASAPDHRTNESELREILLHTQCPFIVLLYTNGDIDMNLLEGTLEKDVPTVVSGLSKRVAATNSAEVVVKPIVEQRAAAVKPKAVVKSGSGDTARGEKAATSINTNKKGEMVAEGETCFEEEGDGGNLLVNPDDLIYCDCQLRGLCRARINGVQAVPVSAVNRVGCRGFVACGSYLHKSCARHEDCNSLCEGCRKSQRALERNWCKCGLLRQCQADQKPSPDVKIRCENFMVCGHFMHHLCSEQCGNLCFDCRDRRQDDGDSQQATSTMDVVMDDGDIYDKVNPEQTSNPKYLNSGAPIQLIASYAKYGSELTHQMQAVPKTTNVDQSNGNSTREATSSNNGNAKWGDIEVVESNLKESNYSFRIKAFDPSDKLRLKLRLFKAIRFSRRNISIGRMKLMVEVLENGQAVQHYPLYNYRVGDAACIASRWFVSKSVLTHPTAPLLVCQELLTTMCNMPVHGMIVFDLSFLENPSNGFRFLVFKSEADYRELDGYVCNPSIAYDVDLVDTAYKAFIISERYIYLPERNLRITTPYAVHSLPNEVARSYSSYVVENPEEDEERQIWMNSPEDDLIMDNIGRTGDRMLKQSAKEQQDAQMRAQMERTIRSELESQLRKEYEAKAKEAVAKRESTIANLQKENAKLSKQVQTLTAQADKLKSCKFEVNDLKKQLNAAKKDAESRVADANQHLNSLQVEFEKLVQVNEELAHSVSSLERQLASTRTTQQQNNSDRQASSSGRGNGIVGGGGKSNNEGGRKRTVSSRGESDNIPPPPTDKKEKKVRYAVDTEVEQHQPKKAKKAVVVQEPEEEEEAQDTDNEGNSYQQEESDCDEGVEQEDDDSVKTLLTRILHAHQNNQHRHAPRGGRSVQLRRQHAVVSKPPATHQLHPQRDDGRRGSTNNSIGGGHGMQLSSMVESNIPPQVYNQQSQQPMYQGNVEYRGHNGSASNYHQPLPLQQSHAVNLNGFGYYGEPSPSHPSYNPSYVNGSTSGNGNGHFQPQPYYHHPHRRHPYN